MKMSNPVRKIFLAIQGYKNWAEVIISIAKRQKATRVILRNGVQIELDERLFWIVNDIFFRHVYNPVNLHIGSNDIVVDIGAHGGMFTLFAACITHNTVYAFEPSPRNFEFLKRNIRANGMNNVTVHNFAVSDKIGSTKLILHPRTNSGDLLFDHLIPDELEKYKTSSGKLENYVEVLTTTLQDIMDSNNIEQIDFLKMDCEGSEGSILQSTPKEYLKRVRKIAMEFHDHLSQFNHNDIQTLLEEAGFIIKLKWDNKSPCGYLYGWRN